MSLLDIHIAVQHLICFLRSILNGAIQSRDIDVPLRILINVY